MEIKGTAYCLFEQSGTFKRAFIQTGIPSVDYDIANDYGQTDTVIDLFQAIESAYNKQANILDTITPDDLVMAFFPCTYFSANNVLFFTGKSRTQKRQSQEKKIEGIMRRANMRHHYYMILLKLCAICETRGLRLIIENPYTQPHYWHNNFPYAPAIIDYDRRQHGDVFRKPTAYYYINCEPTYRQSFNKSKITKTIQSMPPTNITRSIISDEYARAFVCDHILGIEYEYSIPSLF